MRIGDWSSDVCSSDLASGSAAAAGRGVGNKAARAAAATFNSRIAFPLGVPPKLKFCLLSHSWPIQRALAIPLQEQAISVEKDGQAYPPPPPCSRRDRPDVARAGRRRASAPRSGAGSRLQGAPARQAHVTTQHRIDRKSVGEGKRGTVRFEL